jgi:hypothetical protein
MAGTWKRFLRRIGRTWIHTFPIRN